MLPVWLTIFFVSWLSILHSVLCLPPFKAERKNILNDTASVEGAQPSFQGQPFNLTAWRGENVILPCSVQHYSRKYLVAWGIGDPEAVVAMGTTITIPQQQKRFRVITGDNDGTFNLSITGIRPADDGRFRCCVNAQRQTCKTFFLTVKEPPSISHFNTSSVKIVEGRTLKLYCEGRGKPTPVIQWYHRKSNRRHSRQPLNFTTEWLIVPNVTRDCGGAYECEAKSEGWSNSVSRSVSISVLYRPHINIPEQRIGNYRGQSVQIQCNVEFNPPGEIYWIFNDKKVKVEGPWSMYDLEITIKPNACRNITVANLFINKLTEDKFGVYTCVASNSVGRENDAVTIYEITTPFIPTTTTPPRPLYLPTDHRGGYSNNGYQQDQANDRRANSDYRTGNSNGGVPANNHPNSYRSSTACQLACVRIELFTIALFLLLEMYYS